MSIDPFLEATDVVDFDQAEVAEQARALVGADVRATVERCFLFVRDDVAHSVDHRHETLTCAASEVLRARTGFCYAKSHLLVALLRANGVRSGFVYQRLRLDGPDSPFCLHGLVGVFLPEHGLHRIDPRGNRPGVDARFAPPREHLAFTHDLPGEQLFPHVLAAPLPRVVEALRTGGSVSRLLEALPDAESLD